MKPDTPMDIKVELKASANFDPIIKDTPKGVSRLFSLVFGKREANIARHKLLLMAKTKNEYQKILSGEYTFEKGEVIPLPSCTLSNNLNPLRIEEQQELENLSENVKMAAEVLRNIPDSKIPDGEIDDDFFARWRREAKIIGSERLQRIWGRLLAEEITEPGKISFRTLETVKNISNKEATLFHKIAIYIIGERFLPVNINLADNPSVLNFDNLLTLNAAGLISYPDTNAFLIWQNAGKEGAVFKYLIGFNDLVLTVYSKSDPLKIRGVSLTEVGKEIYSICDHATPEHEEINFFIKLLQSHEDNAMTSASALKLLKDGNTITGGEILMEYKV